MTPYTKKIVELHKIHKAIEEKDCCNGGGNTPSGEITIDDVVKFIHDKLKNTPMSEDFPYTTWNDIPDYEDVDLGEICKSNDFNSERFSPMILNIPFYVIGVRIPS